MASLRKRGDKWTAQVIKLGVSKYATFRTKTEAQAWANKTETEILEGRTGNHSNKTFLEALDKYLIEVSPGKKGHKWEAIQINCFKKMPFVNYRIGDVSTPRLAEWRDERLKVVKSSSVNREMNLLSAVFEQARREWQWINVNPVHDVRRPKNPPHRKRIFSESELLRIIEQLGLIDDDVITRQHIVALALLFSIETAMRREEITGLEWDRIHLEQKYLTLPKTKNGDVREVPLSNRAVEILGKLATFDKPFNIGPVVITQMFAKACKAAGIKDAHFHDARATALTRLSEKLDVLELAKMVGHRDPRSLMIYYRKSASDIAKKLD